jgi:ubiquinone/menaquinone biosynthesis C-methylase UbiE
LTWVRRYFPCRNRPTITDVNIGTGTGIWAIEFADAHPSASVTATDLSPIQPTNVPPNLQFVVDDFTAPWLYTKDSVDFIHARSIYGCVSDYPTLYSEVYSTLKPGGWFEQTEISVQSKSDDDSIIGSNLEKFGQLAVEAGKKFGKSFTIAEDSEKLIKEAGFVNVKCKTFKWPIGPWPKDRKMKMIGAYNRLGIEEGLEGWAIFLFTKYLGVSSDPLQNLCVQVFKYH